MTISDHIVHAGFQKTGSTWLQESVFPTVEGAIPTTGNRVVYELLRSLTHEDEFLPDTFRTALDELGGRVLLSWENLGGQPYGVSDVDRNVDRLAEVAPDARIVLVHRDREQMIRSAYSQYVNMGGWRSRKAFEREILTWDFLDFEGTISRFRERFESVHVLPYQTLVNDPDRAIGLLEHWLDVRFPRPLDVAKTNQSLRGWRLQLLRAVNRAFRKSEINPDPWLAVPGAGVLRHLLQRGF